MSTRPRELLGMLMFPLRAAPRRCWVLSAPSEPRADTHRRGGGVLMALPGAWPIMTPAVNRRREAGRVP
eukprot:5343395-Alexandrium_andersonii.AAC.1